MIPLSYNVRNLIVRKTTTIAAGLGIALVTFVLAASLMLSAGIKKTLGSSGSPNNAIVTRLGSDGELASSIDEPTVGLVLNQTGVKKDASGAGLGVGEIVVVILMERAGSKGALTNVQVRGIADRSLEYRPFVHIVEGRAPKPGTDEVIIGKRIDGRFTGLGMNKTFELRKNRPVNVVGVFSANGSSFESEIWADRDTVRSSFGREGLVSSVSVALESPEKFEGFETAVESDKSLGLEAMREDKYFEKMSEGTSIFVTAMGIVITVFFCFGAMIGAMITMYGSVASRQREIGTLRALGFSRLGILFSFLLESVMLALTGALFGIGAALCLGFVKFSMLNFQTWSEVVFSFTPTGSIMMTALVFGAVMGLIGGFLPAIRAARISPAQAMRE